MAAARHGHEIGQGRAVDRPARAGAQHQADLRHHARVQDVPEEDVGVAGQGVDALLDAGPARVVDADHGRAHARGQVHDLADLLGEGLGQAAAENGEVLAEDEDQAPVDGTVARHHAVAEGLLLLQAEVGAAVGHEGVELLEAALVEQPVDAFPGGVLTLVVLLLDALLAASQAGLVAQVGQLQDLALDAHGGRLRGEPRGAGRPAGEGGSPGAARTRLRIEGGTSSSGALAGPEVGRAESSTRRHAPQSSPGIAPPASSASFCPRRRRLMRASARRAALQLAHGRDQASSTGRRARV